MSFLSALIYDRILAPAEKACLKEWRSELLKNISGDVLEIGAGTGSNLALYPDTVQTLVLSEPDKYMRKQMKKKISATQNNITVSTGSAEIIEAENETYDYVISSLVCCSVSRLELALLEIRRVLKPDGCLVFLEHVAATEHSKTRLWQNRINPFWRKLAGNCHLNRETESAIVTAGFKILEIKRERMHIAMPLVMPTIRGIAIKN